MAAITGLLRAILVGPIGPGPTSSLRYSAPAAIAFRSKPAQKVPWEPVSTAARSALSASNRANASRSAAAVAGSIAFRTSGRSMVTVSTAPSTSYPTVLERAPLVVDGAVHTVTIDRPEVEQSDTRS